MPKIWKRPLALILIASLIGEPAAATSGLSRSVSLLPSGAQHDANRFRAEALEEESFLTFLHVRLLRVAPRFEWLKRLGEGLELLPHAVGGGAGWNFEVEWNRPTRMQDDNAQSGHKPPTPKLSENIRYLGLAEAAFQTGDILSARQNLAICLNGSDQVVGLLDGGRPESEEMLKAVRKAAETLSNELTQIEKETIAWRSPEVIRQLSPAAVHVQRFSDQFVLYSNRQRACVLALMNRLVNNVEQKPAAALGRDALIWNTALFLYGAHILIHPLLYNGERASFDSTYARALALAGGPSIHEKLLRQTAEDSAAFNSPAPRLLLELLDDPERQKALQDLWDAQARPTLEHVVYLLTDLYDSDARDRGAIESVFERDPRMKATLADLVRRWDREDAMANQPLIVKATRLLKTAGMETNPGPAEDVSLLAMFQSDALESIRQEESDLAASWDLEHFGQAASLQTARLIQRLAAAFEAFTSRQRAAARVMLEMRLNTLKSQTGREQAVRVLTGLWIILQDELAEELFSLLAKARSDFGRTKSRHARGMIYRLIQDCAAESTAPLLIKILEYGGTSPGILARLARKRPELYDSVIDLLGLSYMGESEEKVKAIIARQAGEWTLPFLDDVEDRLNRLSQFSPHGQPSYAEKFPAAFHRLENLAAELRHQTGQTGPAVISETTYSRSCPPGGSIGILHDNPILVATADGQNVRIRRTSTGPGGRLILQRGSSEATIGIPLDGSAVSAALKDARLSIHVDPYHWTLIHNDGPQPATIYVPKRMERRDPDIINRNLKLLKSDGMMHKRFSFRSSDDSLISQSVLLQMKEDGELRETKVFHEAGYKYVTLTWDPHGDLSTNPGIEWIIKENGDSRQVDVAMQGLHPNLAEAIALYNKGLDRVPLEGGDGPSGTVGNLGMVPNGTPARELNDRIDEIIGRARADGLSGRVREMIVDLEIWMTHTLPELVADDEKILFEPMVQAVWEAMRSFEPDEIETMGADGFLTFMLQVLEWDIANHLQGFQAAHTGRGADGQADGRDVIRGRNLAAFIENALTSDDGHGLWETRNDEAHNDLKRGHVFIVEGMIRAAYAAAWKNHGGSLQDDIRLGGRDAHRDWNQAQLQKGGWLSMSPRPPSRALSQAA